MVLSNSLARTLGRRERRARSGGRTRAAVGCAALTALGAGLVAQAAGPTPTFAPVVTFRRSRVEPNAVAVADMNGDGKPDLIAASSFYNNLGVLLGDGFGGFGAAATFPSGGNYPSSVAVADVNADGKPDLLAANPGSNRIGVLLGDGFGGFAATLAFHSGGNRPNSVAVADVNNDGNLDLVVTNSNSETLGVLLGNGAGGFGGAATFPSGGFGPQSVVAADVNGDGKPDLITANYLSNTLGVLLGNGSGGFASAITFPSGGYRPSSVAVADVNGDGKPDLVAASGSNDHLGVLAGNGSGGFASAVTFPSGGDSPQSVTVADVNGDGKPDLIAANIWSYNLGLLLNTTVTDVTPPTGTPLAVGTSGASNGQAFVPVRLRDSGSGVKKVQLTANSSNVHLEYPLGIPVTSPLELPSPLADVTVYAVKNTNAKARVELRIWDDVNNSAVVDPIVANLESKNGRPFTRTFKKIPQAERYVRLQNGAPGFASAKLWINGRIVSQGKLTSGQAVDLDVVHWLKPGDRNTATILATGPKGATAILTVGDVPTGVGAANARIISCGQVNLEFSR